MKTYNKILVLLIILLLTLVTRESFGFPCNGVNPPNCNCDNWTTNQQWGGSILIPTGDPTCYYIVDYNFRECQCGPGWTKYQFKILGITKYGSCAGKTDREIFTEVYSFILLIAKVLFEIPINVFELDIISPACYQWVGNQLQGCMGNACCHKTWLVRYNEELERTEIGSVVTQNEICSVIYNCPNLCDSLYLSDGTITYPAWPSNCIAQDPCPNVPWSFNPYRDKVYGMVGTCPFVAFYETKICDANNDGQNDVLFRVKFVQVACTDNRTDREFLAKTVKRILNEIFEDYPFYLLSYSCWTRIPGYDYPRVVPCLDVSECCLIEYLTNGPRYARTLWNQNLINSGNSNCSDNCVYVCDTLSSFEIGRLPDRFDPRIAIPEEINPPEPRKESNRITFSLM